MHIVVISGYYYPYLIPPVGCLKPYLLALAEEHDIEIVCPVSDTEVTESFKLNGITINYVNSFLNQLQVFVKKYEKINRQHKLKSAVLFSFRGLRFISSLVSNCPYETHLIPSYLSKLNEINDRKKIDIIISVSSHFYCHIVALRYKENHNKTRWLSYTTDPFAYNETNPIESRKLNRAIKEEKNVYTKCDHCFVTEELYDNLVSEYGIPKDKITKLPFLISKKTKETTTHTPNGLSALYAGYVYHHIRNPQIMLDVFSELPNIKLVLHVNGDRECREILGRRYPDNIVIGGLLPLDLYVEELQKASILINIGNNVCLQAPSKLYELIATGKPILNFYQIKDSGYYAIEKYPLGLNINYNSAALDIADKINSFCQENNNKTLQFEEIQKIFPEHCLEIQLMKIKKYI